MFVAPLWAKEVVQFVSSHAPSFTRHAIQSFNLSRLEIDGLLVRYRASWEAWAGLFVRGCHLFSAVTLPMSNWCSNY